jgi:NTE family protein
MDRMSAASAFVFGVPGFFNPRPVPPFFAAEGTLDALSFYDTAPLKATLEELVDFDLINRKQVRRSLGAVTCATVTRCISTTARCVSVLTHQAARRDA